MKDAAVKTMTPKQRERILAQMKKHLTGIAAHRDAIRKLADDIADDAEWANECHEAVQIAVEKMSEYV